MYFIVTSISILPDKDCINDYGVRYSTGNAFCAGNAEGYEGKHRDTCQGDSGGPFTIHGSSHAENGGQTVAGNPPVERNGRAILWGITRQSCKFLVILFLKSQKKNSKFIKIFEVFLEESFKNFLKSFFKKNVEEFLEEFCKEFVLKDCLKNFLNIFVEELFENYFEEFWKISKI